MPLSFLFSVTVLHGIFKCFLKENTLTIFYFLTNFSLVCLQLANCISLLLFSNCKLVYVPITATPGY